MYRSLALTSLTLLSAVRAQQVGTSTTETHPKLNWKTCTGTGGNSCTTKAGSIVLDSNWRWTHNTGGYTNCYTGSSWDATLCPDGDTCAKNCAIDGADYSGTSFSDRTSKNLLTQPRYLRYHRWQRCPDTQVRHQGPVL
jgi:cellulose 1,4-beta-cellobiosidase